MKKSTWTGVGLTYVGTVIGAGYASGQEIWQFFGRHGAAGILGLLLAGTLFMTVGFFALEAGRTHYSGFDQFLRTVYGHYSRGFDLAMGLFLVAGIGVVAAGGGAAAHVALGIPEALGGMATLGLVIATARGGARAIIRANSLLIPLLMGLIALTAILTPPITHPPPRWSGTWWQSAFLYASYNLFTAATVLIGLGKQLMSRRESLLASMLAAAVLTGTALLEHRALAGLEQMGPLPMVDAARSIHPGLGAAYSLCLIVALYTTGIGEAWALAARYSPRILSGLWASILFLLWPFDALVGTIYPFLGVFSVAFWGPLLWPMRHRPRR